MAKVYSFVQILSITNNNVKEFFRMVRLLGVDLPRNKRVSYALTSIHGIGIASSREIIKLAGISSEIRTNNLTTEQTIALRKVLETLDLKLEGDLRRFNGLNIKRLNEINCHRGKTTSY